MKATDAALPVDRVMMKGARCLAPNLTALVFLSEKLRWLHNIVLLIGVKILNKLKPFEIRFPIY